MYFRICILVFFGFGSYWYLKFLVIVRDFNLVRNCIKKVFICIVKYIYGEVYGMSDFDFM